MAPKRKPGKSSKKAPPACPSLELNAPQPCPFDSPLVAESTADNMGVIILANEAFAKMWGYESSEEVLGKPVIHFFKEKECATTILTALERKGTWKGQFVAQTKRKVSFIAQVQGKLLRDSRGHRVGFHAKFVKAPQ